MKATLAAVGISFWLAMAGGVSAGPSFEERIVGGDVADPADWPYIAAITTPSGQQFCGGTVISPDAVLTAGHCVAGANPGQIRVITSRPDLSNEATGQVRAVQDVFVHPKFLRRGRHDVAVLRFGISTMAPPAALPTPAEDATETAPGEELRVAGWGSTKRAGGRDSDVLRDVATFAVEDRKCSSSFRFFRPGEEICTQGERTGEHRRSACYGDSGGPLIADSPSGALLAGVVSYGGTRCGVKKPTVYARVADNLAFIENKADLRR